MYNRAALRETTNLSDFTAPQKHPLSGVFRSGWMLLATIVLEGSFDPYDAEGLGLAGTVEGGVAVMPALGVVPGRLRDSHPQGFALLLQLRRDGEFSGTDGLGGAFLGPSGLEAPSILLGVGLQARGLEVLLGLLDRCGGLLGGLLLGGLGAGQIHGGSVGHRDGAAARQGDLDAGSLQLAGVSLLSVDRGAEGGEAQGDRDSDREVAADADGRVDLFNAEHDFTPS